ncbi:hypothetical protein DENSPDRAFT_689689 [Dentipellis sp. KUC8613]|nr:hypothetical protein DENSPDRAFT_689689 [Dentipellis sp. KUC8613]
MTPPEMRSILTMRGRTIFGCVFLRKRIVCEGLHPRDRHLHDRVEKLHIQATAGVRRASVSQEGDWPSKQVERSREASRNPYAGRHARIDEDVEQEASCSTYSTGSPLRSLLRSLKEALFLIEWGLGDCCKPHLRSIAPAARLSALTA